MFKINRLNPVQEHKFLTLHKWATSDFPVAPSDSQVSGGGSPHQQMINPLHQGPSHP